VVINAETGAKHLVWSELDSNPPEPEGRPQPAHPARGQLRRGHALHRRPAAHAPRGRQHHPADPRLRGLPRQDRHDRRQGRGPPGGDGGHLRHARQVGRRARRPLPRVGLHHRDGESTTSRLLHMRDDAFEQLDDTNLATARSRARRRRSKCSRTSPTPR
jgi:hypothetical protein